MVPSLNLSHHLLNKKDTQIKTEEKQKFLSGKSESRRTSGLNLTGDLLINNDEYLNGLVENVDIANESFNQ